MKHFRKIWDNDKNSFILSTKGMSRQEALAAFRKRYPELKNDVTETAFYNQRSRIKAANTYCGKKYSRKAKPLYSEHIKKGYVRIKVAQPSTWMMKSEWVYKETHPWEDFSENSAYIFLDGNTRNFNPENIERIPRKLMGVFSVMGGCIKGNPELTKLNITRAKLKLAQYDALEKCGEVHVIKNKDGIERRDKKVVRERARKYAQKNKELLRERRIKKYWENREEYLAKQREYRKIRSGK